MYGLKPGLTGENSRERLEHVSVAGECIPWAAAARPLMHPRVSGSGGQLGDA